MEKLRDDVCGYGGRGTNKPLYELRHLIEVVERQEAERKAKEKHEMLAAASRWAMKEGAA